MFLGIHFSPEITDKVNKFYHRQDISAEMSGSKDCITIKDENGTKIKIQKYLLLGNIREIYAIFKEENPGLKLGFSTFAALRPKECVFAGSAGTHTVCVCSTHQNVKLSIIGTKSLLIYFIFLCILYIILVGF